MGLVRKPSWSGEYLPFGAVGMTVAPVRALRSGRIVRARRRGLGTDLRIDPVTGQSLDCDAWGNLFNATCWGAVTTKGTQSYIYGGTPYLSTTGPALPTLAKGAAAPVLVPGTVSTLPAGTQDNPQAAIDSLVAQQTAANQAATQQFFVDLSAQNQQNAGCSQNLFSGVCDWVTLGAVALGVFGFVWLGGRH